MLAARPAGVSACSTRNPAAAPGRATQVATEVLRDALHRLPPRWQQRLRALRQGLHALLHPAVADMAMPPPAAGTCPRCGIEAPQQSLGGFAATQPGPFSVERFELLHCACCDVVRLEPPPTADDFKQLYEGACQFADPLYREPTRVARMLDYYGRAIDQLQLLPPRDDEPRLLEVGAGRAWLARAARTRHAGLVAVAQDLSGECAADCPWVDHYLVGPLEDIDMRGFDLASLTHVLEHLPDPAGTLRWLATRLRTGGRIFITAPYRPPGYRLRHGAAPWQDYDYLHVPAHLSYLSRRWFELVAPTAGLRLVHFDATHDRGQAFEAVLELA